MAQNYPFPNSFPTFFTDLGLNNQNPGLGFGGTETGALYFEDREVNGVMYRVQNATWNKVAQKWLLVDNTKPAYAMQFSAGVLQILTNPAGNSPFTAWTLLSSFSNPGVLNVMAFGAKGDGINDDTSAIQSALNAVGGSAFTVYFPAGSYKLSTALIPKDGTIVQGSGMFSTILLAPSGVSGGAGAAINLALAQGSWYTTGVTVRDIGIDGTNQYRVGGPNISNFNFPSGANLEGVNNLLVENVYVKNPAGFGLTIGGGGGVTQQVTNVRLRNIYVSGEWNGNDSIGGGAVDGLTVENYRCINPAGTGMDLVWATNFVWKNIYVTSDGSNRTNGTVGLMSDSGSSNGIIDSVFIDGCTSGIILESATGTAASTNQPAQISINNFKITNSQKNAIFFNTASGTSKYPVNIDIGKGYIDGWNLSGAGSASAINMAGGDHINIHDVELGPNSGGGGAYACIFSADTNARSVTNLNIHDVDMRAPGTSMLTTGVDFTTARIHDNPGYNPVGGAVAQPTVGASPWAYTNNTGVKETLYISGGTVSSIVIDGKTTGTTSGSFGLPVGKSITVTYSAAPTVVAVGE